MLPKFSIGVLLLIFCQFDSTSAAKQKCPLIRRVEKDRCCTEEIEEPCKLPRFCWWWVRNNCPDRKLLVLVKKNRTGKNSELRRSPTTTEEPVLNLPTENDISNRETEQPNEQSIVEAESHDTKEQKCGTAESNYQPCTSRGIADKLFLACCQLYVPDDCHYLCTYETEQLKTRRMLLDMIKQKKCGMKHLSTILYCASQNRDNRKCCEALDLNAPSLQIGSRCLRMCDPSGTSVERITKDDVTCLYNFNVIMYCHHAGITEM